MAIDSNNPINTKLPDVAVAVGLSAALNVLVLSTSVFDATSNTMIIQAAIDAGQEVNVSAGPGGGEVYINNTLTIGDKQTLTTVKGTVLRQAPAVNKVPVVTKAYLAAWSTGTIGWTAGATSPLALPAHGLVVGDSIVINGAVNGSGVELHDWWDGFEVITVTDADNVVIALPRIPTVAPTGTVNVKRCHRSVKLDVDVFWDFAKNPGATANNRHAAIMAFVADSDTLKVRSRDVHKYGLMLAGVRNVQASSETYPFANSDTVKVYGPYENVVVRAKGTAPEDCFSTQALEPAAFIAYMPCRGHGRNIEFIQPTAGVLSAGSGAGVIYSDDRYTQRNIKLTGGVLRSRGVGIPPLQIRPGVDFTAAQSLLRDVTLDQTRLEPGDVDAIRVITKLRTLTLRQVDFRKPTADSRFMVYVTNAGIVDTLLIDGVVFDDATWPAAAASYFVNNEGVIRNMIFRNCYFNASTFMTLFRQGGAATTQRLVFDNCQVDQGGQLARIESSAANAPIVEVLGGKYAGMTIGVSAYRSAKVIARGVDLSGMTGGLARANGASAVIELHEQGCTFSGGSVPFAVGTAGGTVDVKSQSTPINIGATGINKSAGNMCFNTTAQGTIPANTLVAATGTQWKSVLDPSLVF